jgi:hypothetical protein
MANTQLERVVVGVADGPNQVTVTETRAEGPAGDSLSPQSACCLRTAATNGDASSVQLCCLWWGHAMIRKLFVFSRIPVISRTSLHVIRHSGQAHMRLGVGFIRPSYSFGYPIAPEYIGPAARISQSPPAKLVDPAVPP